MDFVGSATLAATIGSLLMACTFKSTESLPWSHPLVCGLFITSVGFGVLFVTVEAYWSPYPVMPLYFITQRTPLAVSLSNLFGSMSAFSMVRTLPNLFPAEVDLLDPDLQCAIGVYNLECQPEAGLTVPSISPLFV